MCVCVCVCVCVSVCVCVKHHSHLVLYEFTLLYTLGPVSHNRTLRSKITKHCANTYYYIIGMYDKVVIHHLHCDVIAHVHVIFLNLCTF